MTAGPWKCSCPDGANPVGVRKSMGSARICTCQEPPSGTWPPPRSRSARNSWPASSRPCGSDAAFTLTGSKANSKAKVAAVLTPSPEDHSTSVVIADVAGEARTFARIASSSSCIMRPRGTRRIGCAVACRPVTGRRIHTPRCRRRPPAVGARPRSRSGPD
jgi:hypothetical protein